MSLQVATSVPVGFLSRGDEATVTGPATRPVAGWPEPAEVKPILTLTCRDVLDEARQRLARKEFFWE